MMHDLLVIPCALLGAVTFRIRGGMLEDWYKRDQVSRLSWAAACAATVYAGGGAATAWAAAATLPLVFGASTLGLFHTIDMGRNVDTAAEQDQSFTHRFLRDFAMGHLHGLTLGASVAIPLAALMFVDEWRPLWWLPLVGGAGWGLCYALAWLRLDWPEVRAVHLGKFGNPPEAAELAFGAAFAASVFFAAT
jgi:hypothetical protein